MRYVKFVVLVVLLSGAFTWGFLSHRNGIPPYSLLRSFFGKGVDEEQVLNVQSASPTPDALMGLPYLDSMETSNPQDVGVLIHAADRAFPGLNFYHSSKRPNPILMDMEGEIVREWRLPGEKGWNHAELLPTGDVIAVEDETRVVRIDRDSRLMWSRELDVHHGVWVTPANEVLALGSKRVMRPEIHPEIPVRDQLIVRIGADGEVEEEISLLEVLERSPYAFLLPRLLDRPLHRGVRRSADAELDILHANHVEVFDGTHAGRWSGFAEGNILVCIRNINTIAVLARRDGRWEVVWVWGPSNLTFPHHPTVTPTGSVLTFNNGIKESEAVEMDPATGKVLWRYAPGPDRFFSRIRGSCQRLPNGNTLITESDRGGVFEVTPEKEVVWRFANPAIQGDRREIIWRMVRFSPEDLPFLGESQGPR